MQKCKMSCYLFKAGVCLIYSFMIIDGADMQISALTLSLEMYSVKSQIINIQD